MGVEEIEAAIAKNGGNVRDALNVALAKINVYEPLLSKAKEGLLKAVEASKEYHAQKENYDGLIANLEGQIGLYKAIVEEAEKEFKDKDSEIAQLEAIEKKWESYNKDWAEKCSALDAENNTLKKRLAEQANLAHEYFCEIQNLKDEAKN